MNIHYKNNKVKDQCTDLRIAKKKLPTKIALKLFKCINFIQAADTLVSVQNNRTLRFHGLKGNLSNLYAMDIDGQSSAYRLLVQFDGYTHEQVFSEARKITIIEVMEVSKHYE